LRQACGEAVLDDPTQLSHSRPAPSDNGFSRAVRNVKLHNKVVLARLIGERLGIKVDPSALFDVQISASTNTSGSCSTSWKPSRSITRSRTIPSQLGAARENLRRQAAASYRYAKLISS